MLNSHSSTFSASFALVFAVGLCTAACGGAPTDEPAGDALTSGTSVDVRTSKQDLPVLPSSTLAVPAGNRLAFFFDATGVQIYGCQASGSTYAWTFVAPEANLYGQNGKLVGTHYVGPTWQFKDGSTVVGKKLVGFTADPTAIPELLLQAVSHGGDGRMSDVTYVQRLETTGGLAPSSGCDATTVGATARVDYTATYYFYAAGDELAAD